MYSQCQTGEDVSCDGKGNEERFEGERLVVWPCEEEIGFGGWNGAGYERNYGSVRYMEGGVDSEDVRRVALEPSHYAVSAECSTIWN